MGELDWFMQYIWCGRNLLMNSLQTNFIHFTRSNETYVYILDAKWIHKLYSFQIHQQIHAHTFWMLLLVATVAVEANLFSNIIFAHFYLIFEIFMPWKSINGINHVNNSIYLDYLDWASICSRVLICLRYHSLAALVVHITRFVTQLLFGIYWVFFHDSSIFTKYRNVFDWKTSIQSVLHGKILKYLFGWERFSSQPSLQNWNVWTFKLF